MLAGIVESGAGCGQPNFPGIYDGVADADVGTFITSNPPQAPQQQSPTTVSGTPASGQTVSCQPGAWSGGPSFLYEFYKDLGNQNFQRIAGPAAQSTYAVQPADVGSQIFCVVKATAAGGYGFGRSAGRDRLGPGADDPSAARHGHQAAHPGRGAQELQHPRPLRGEPAGGRSVAERGYRQGGLQAALAHDRALPHTAQRALRQDEDEDGAGKAIGGGHYLIVVSHLSPRTYALILRAVDKAGNHQRSSTYVTLKVKRARSRA